MNNCPITTNLNRHDAMLARDSRRELFIEDRSAEHEKGLLNHGVTIIEQASGIDLAGTIESDVEPLLCDVISAHEFDVLAGQVVFALARQFHAEHCLIEQQAADMEIIKQFADVGLKAIKAASKEIAAKEWGILHG